MESIADQVRTLRALREEGLLSQREFEERRDALLDAAGASVPPAAADPGTELGLMAGQLVGPPGRRYRLERLIAAGGMGQVWQATDLATRSELGHSAQVALKILAPEPDPADGEDEGKGDASGGAGAQARLLLQEATRARRLAHEHIVRVYDWAQDPATSSYFLIMECLAGEDLGSLLARSGPLPLGRALALLEPVAAALDYAWEKHGLVHRDIKPANVFLTLQGEVKLLDFGIAARVRAVGRTDGPGPHEAPARSGTPGYRAPEADTPGLAPARTLDVYAVARMLARMVGNALPRDTDPARPPAVEEAAWQVLRSGWAADPATRPDSVSALLAGVRAAAGASLAPPVAATGAETGLVPPPQTGADEVPGAAADGVAEPVQHAQAVAEQPPGPAAGLPAEPDEELPDAPAPQAPPLAPLPAPRISARESAADAPEDAAARQARRAALRAQLAAHRASALDAARQEEEDAQRRVLQAKAAAAYLAEQERVQTVAQAPASPPPRLLRDRFLSGEDTGPELVVLRAGRFQMGSPEHERKLALAAGTRAHWLARETPQRWVGIERPFALGRYPVTVGEWRAFAEASGWRGGGRVDWEAPGFAQTPVHPVVGVSWHDAQAYLSWLGERTGRRYRLPSEAEWEYACRAGTRGAFHFGEHIDTSLANYDGGFAWNGGPVGASRGGTTPVTLFAPNPWGLHDMHGNVWEWVQDVLHDSYAGAPGDGRAWEDTGGGRARRVLRGGCWRYHPRYLRSALRNGVAATMANEIIGFRVARELEDDEIGVA